MGTQQSSLGRTKSLGEYESVDYLQNNASSSSGQLRTRTDSAESSLGRLDRDQRSKSTLVVVHRPSISADHYPRLEDDSLFQKLDQLPMFVPLMHEVESGYKLFGGARNRALQDIRSKIEPSPFIRIVHMYEDRLKRHADFIQVEQGRLSKCVREIDMEVGSIFKTLIERQKRFAKVAENLGKMNDMTHTLNKCQTMLKQCERSIQILNGFLPKEERLEPFSWPELFEDEHHSGEVNSKVLFNATTTLASRTKSIHHSSSSYGQKRNNLDLDESIEVAVEQGES